jgi:hypothetical protein
MASISVFFFICSTSEQRQGRRPATSGPWRMA